MDLGTFLEGKSWIWGLFWAPFSRETRVDNSRSKPRLFDRDFERMLLQRTTVVLLGVAFLWKKHEKTIVRRKKHSFSLKNKILLLPEFPRPW